MTYAESQRRQTIRCIAGCAFVATLMLLAPLRISYGERQYCRSQEIHRTPAQLRASDYNGPAGEWIEENGDGAIFGYATAEDSPIYPTIQTAERCS